MKHNPRRWLTLVLLTLPLLACEEDEDLSGWIRLSLQPGIGAPAPSIGAAVVRFGGAIGMSQTANSSANLEAHREFTVQADEDGPVFLIVNDEGQSASTELARIFVSDTGAALRAAVVLDQICDVDDAPLDPGDYTLRVARLVD